MQECEIDEFNVYIYAAMIVTHYIPIRQAIVLPLLNTQLALTS